MSARQWLYLVLAGFAAAGGQFSITAAYRLAPAREISVYDYSQVLFAALLGILVLGEWPDALSAVGYVVIISAAAARFIWGKKAEKKEAAGMVRFVALRDISEKENEAAEWFHGKWGVPAEAYLECMDDYLSGKTELGWYLCLDGDRIVGGLGVIENDFHDRKDLSPNECAVYTEEEYRCKGIAGRLLNMAVEDLRAKGISPVYLVTDHTGFYERYGWEFLCMVQGDGEPDMTRMYIHR